MYITQTNLHRMEFLRCILEEVDLGTRILEIGAGLEFGPVLCPIEPFYIASRYHKKSIDYSMTIVDPVSAVIDDLRDRKQVHVPGLALRDLQTRLLWNDYLAAIHADNEMPANASCTTGCDVAAAPIPSSFRVGGNVHLQNTMIQSAALDSYDVIVAMNLFYQVPQYSHGVVLSKLSEAMEPQSHLILTDQNNEKRGIRHNPLFREFGGKLCKQDLRKYGLTLEYWDVKSGSPHPFGVAVIQKTH